MNALVPTRDIALRMPDLVGCAAQNCSIGAQDVSATVLAPSLPEVTAPANDANFGQDRDLQALYRCRLGTLEGQHGVDWLYRETSAHAIALHLLRCWSDAVPDEAERGGSAPWQVRRACDLLVSRLDGDVSLAEAADAVGLSETHFSRAFRRSTGLTPGRWRRERRS